MLAASFLTGIQVYINILGENTHSSPSFIILYALIVFGSKREVKGKTEVSLYILGKEMNCLFASLFCLISQVATGKVNEAGDGGGVGE